MSVKKSFITVSLDKLKPYENNPRINEPAIPDTIESIKQCENLDPIEVDEGFVILSGHTRLAALQQLGYTETEVVQYEGLTDEQKRKYRVLANKTGEKALWDFSKLEEELKDLDFGDFDFGFELSNGGADSAEVSEDDYDKEPPEEPRSKVGDLYRLGEHRLICGDSTDAAVIENLMGGVKADMVFTDPPYGVSYTDKNEFLNSIDNADRLVNAIENDSKTPEEMYEFWIKAFSVLNQFSAEKMSYYITAPQGGDLLLLLQAVRDSGFALKHVLVWNKNNHVLGRCDYNYKHEPIVYGWKQK